MDANAPAEKDHLPPTLQNGRRLLRRGVAAYLAVAIVPITVALVAPAVDRATPFVWSVFLAGCMVVAPFKALRGSENWKLFAGVIALLLAMGTFLASCVLVGGATPYGILSLVLFGLSCYIVKVFMINQDVKDYVAALRAARSKSGKA